MDLILHHIFFEKAYVSATIVLSLDQLAGNTNLTEDVIERIKKLIQTISPNGKEMKAMQLQQ